jgi:hypothetical protein
MESKNKNTDQLELQLKNLENENKVLRSKIKEQNTNGKFLNDLYSLLENDKNDQDSENQDNSEVLKLK